MRKSKPAATQLTIEDTIDPHTPYQLLELVQDKLRQLSDAHARLTGLASRLEDMVNSNPADKQPRYNWEFFSPVTVDTQLQISLLV